MVKFFIALVGVSLIIIAALHLAVTQHALAQLPSFCYQTVLFVALTTAIIFRYLYKIEKPEIFVQLFLLMMAVKLLGYGAYVYFMIDSDKIGTKANVTCFLLMYIVCTTLEIFFLFKKINQKK